MASITVLRAKNGYSRRASFSHPFPIASPYFTTASPYFTTRLSALTKIVSITMPPKVTDKLNKLTLLKLKKEKVTYLLPIDLTTKTGKSLDNFQKQLATIINESGGFQHDSTIEDMETDAIEVPKSEFLSDDEEQQQPQATVVAKELKIAIPKDKSNPYGNEWFELTKDNIHEIDFSDYSILAFASHGDEFNIVEAAYED